MLSIEDLKKQTLWHPLWPVIVLVTITGHIYVIVLVTITGHIYVIYSPSDIFKERTILSIF